jgi:hypothetical protein
MPKLTNIDINNTCVHCESQDFYIKKASNKMRCVEKVSQCPDFIKKARATRNRNPL